MPLYHAGVSQVAAFVLAGGRSSRMGQDKALVVLAGETLLKRALNLAGAVTENVEIVGAIKTFATMGRVIEDIFPAQGPLAGIHSALTHSHAALNLILAVDLPFVEAAFLQYLLAEASRSSAIVTLARDARGWQPLCAVYRRAFAEAAERALRDGKNKIDALFEQIEVCPITEQAMRRQGFSTDMFRNLNTREELERAELELGGV